VSRPRPIALALTVVLAGVTYLHGLGSPHIPRNGDEYAYTHIARLTAASGELLPLRSEIPGVRNTKPPLLFWQGILSTDRGRSFSLLRLRLPSVAYTFLTALLVLLLGQRLGGDVRTGLVAALVFLGFFATYRYGRPYLTNAPEVFWLFVPLFVLLHGRPASFASRALVPAGMGLALGLGFLYKSFALAVPTGLGLGLWYWQRREKPRIRGFLAQDLGKVALAVAVGLGVFATWFLLDPDPRAVWDEFVVGENLGKLDLAGYLPGLAWGRFSVPSLALGFLLNAGLLVLPVAALVVSSWRDRRELGDAERLLWTWVLALFAVYCVPSQRSSRYLLPALPAVAVLLALRWPRIRRGVLVATLLLAALPLVVMAGLSLVLQGSLPGPPPYGPGHWALLAAGGSVLLASLLAPSLTRAGVLAAVFLVLLSLSSLLRPLDGPRGRYDEEAVAAVASRDVWVPVDFIGKEEGYRLLLPGARVHGYRDERGLSARTLLERHPRVVVRLRPGEPLDAEARVLGERLDLRGRHRADEVRAMLGGQVFEHLFVREVLLERPGSAPTAASDTGVPAR
jgi:4-amino-4-deoxy-L-arabinose transferase-like glycosyltransferase